MKILFLSPRQCWPVQSGAKLRDYHFARALGAESQLTYLYFVQPGASPMAPEDMPFCHRLVGVAKPAAYGALNLARGAIGPVPLPILNYASAEMARAVAAVATPGAFDLVHVDSIHMHQFAVQAAARSGAAIVCNWHNIESEAMRRFAGTVSSPFKRWYAQATAGKLERMERTQLRDAAGHVVCSAREQAELAGWAPQARLHVAENGVDCAYFTGDGPQDDRTVRLVYVGSMDYFPNVEAATSFVRNIWPAIRAAHPTATLTFVGANPTAEVKALGSVDGVTVTGTVPDVRPYYSRALASIVPLRTGGGTRLKILESMSMGTPVISTTIGAEGLDVTPGGDILIADADSREQWVAHVSSLLDDAALRQQLVTRGRALAVDQYDWRNIGRRLAETYRRWLGESTVRR